MDLQPDESVRTKMESLRLACNKEISAQEHKIDTWTASFRDSLASIGTRAQETVKCKGKIGEAKAKLREAEDELFKALAVKTRKEAKRMTMQDAIAARKARIDQLQRAVQNRNKERDEYDEVHSLQFSESEEKSSQETKEDTVEAISWYNKVLGFHIEGGHGVRFTFKNINLKNPDEEFSFTVRHANDTYTLLDCNPCMNETEELIQELNKTNGLFKFVRDMRQKFQAAAMQGLPTVHQDYSVISVSAPALSMSTERTESLDTSYDYQVQHEEVRRQVKKFNRGNVAKQSLSPQSVRRSPRSKTMR